MRKLLFLLFICVCVGCDDTYYTPGSDDFKIVNINSKVIEGTWVSITKSDSIVVTFRENKMQKNDYKRASGALINTVDYGTYKLYDKVYSDKTENVIALTYYENEEVKNNMVYTLSKDELLIDYPLMLKLTKINTNY